MLSLSFRQIEYAVAVMEYGSLSKAALAINISQPALSVAISHIESHFGKTLFIRRKGASVVPTSFGVSFLSDANVLLDQFEKLINTDGENFKQKKPIVMGCFTDLAPLILAPIIVKINEMFPDLNVTTSVDDFENLSTKFKDGLIDFAIT
ncbi:MAG: LysR family transcriptional regulator, partial [Emcibacteraceae bacterium]|nr:LysR family transcriptional regulator [Emcibacteraceae bacterium]